MIEYNIILLPNIVGAGAEVGVWGHCVSPKIFCLWNYIFIIFKIKIFNWYRAYIIGSIYYLEPKMPVVYRTKSAYLDWWARWFAARQRCIAGIRARAPKTRRPSRSTDETGLCKTHISHGPWCLYTQNLKTIVHK